MMVNTQYQPISILVELRFELLHEFLPAKVKQLVNVPKTYLWDTKHRRRMQTSECVQSWEKRKAKQRSSESLNIQLGFSGTDRQRQTGAAARPK